MATALESSPRRLASCRATRRRTYRTLPATQNNDAGKRTNRGFEGLAISPDGSYVYAMLQSAMLDEGGSGGQCNRIVKFSTETRLAVAPVCLQDGRFEPRTRHLRSGGLERP